MLVAIRADTVIGLRESHLATAAIRSEDDANDVFHFSFSLSFFFSLSLPLLYSIGKRRQEKKYISSLHFRKLSP